MKIRLDLRCVECRWVTSRGAMSPKVQVCPKCGGCLCEPPKRRFFQRAAIPSLKGHRADLKAKLSTAEATIARLTAEVGELTADREGLSDA